MEQHPDGSASSPPVDSNDPDARIRLTRYIIGDLDPVVRKEVERWVAANARQAELLRGMRAAWATARRQSDRHPSLDVDAARNAVLTRIDAVKQQRLTADSERVRDVRRPFNGRGLRASAGRPSLSRYVVGACATAAAVTFAIVGLRMQHQGRQVAAPPLTYTTDRGQRATITLPDGSVVMLNVASRLEVPSDFPAGDHVLHLEGQASFDIRHHDRTAFTVISGPITTRVLGTRFVVRHYATDAASTVAVHDGKVSVRGAVTHPVVLVAAQQAEFGRDGVVRIGPADPGAFGFETGVLTITRMRLRDAIPELNRWYDADIRLADPSLGNQLLTSRLASGSLTDLGTMLELTFDARVVRNNRVFTLYHR